MIKGSIQQEDMTMINICAPNTGAPTYVKQILTELTGEIEGNAFILGDFNTPLILKDRSTRQKMSRETEALNNAIEQMDLTDIYRTLQPKAAEYTFFSSAHGTFSRTDHILGHKKSLSNFKKIEIVPTSFSDHKGMKLQINYTKNMKNRTNTGRLHNMLLNNQWINDQIKTQIKQYMETNDNNNSTPQKPVGCSQGHAKRKVYRNTGLPQERRKIPYEHSKLTINETRKRTTTNEAQSQ